MNPSDASLPALLLDSLPAPFPQASSHIPQVVKSGSLTSPTVLSPSVETDFFLSRNGADAAGDLLPSVVPPGHSNANMPLYSPSERATNPMASMDAMMQAPNVFTELNQMDFSLPTPPLTDTERLRLPSFNLLGIAAPHPDDVGRGACAGMFDPVSHSSSTWRDEVCEMDMLDSPDCRNSNSTQRHHDLPKQPILSRPVFRRSVELITPPEDSPPFIFATPANSITASARDMQNIDLALSSTTTGGPQASQQGCLETATLASNTGEERDESVAWLEKAMPAIINSVNTPTLASSSLKVLSHALPSPSLPGHAFSRIIEQLRGNSPSNPITWINLLHAVPGRLALDQLPPSSPPSTPGLPLGGGEDYFTTKFFESAVTAVNFETGVMPTRTNLPLAAPSSINLNIVERYIPPTNSNEFVNLFSIRAPSLLVDRLTELTPGNGCLVFIYPTRKGGEIFLRDYLGPILDPLLRSTVVIHNFTADLSTNLGRMNSIERLLDFQTMRHKTEQLCNELNTNTPLARQRLHGTTGPFSLVYADTHDVPLDREVWADWWIKQEKPRVRLQVAKYFASRPPGDGGMSASSLVQELLDGIASKPYQTPPTSKIEVGVYVVKRSK